MLERDFSESYSRDYLASVSFEVRFPPLLAIHNMLPDFQKLLRNRYPKIGKGFSVTFDGFMPSFASEATQWSFATKDDSIQVRISVDRVAIVTTKYQGFDSLLKEISDIISHLSSSTTIESYSRVGLRYVNEIVIDSKNDVQKELAKYFQPALSQKWMMDHPFRFECEIRTKRDANVFVTSRNRFAKTLKEEYTYIIDIDAFVEEPVEKKNLDKLVNKLHDNALASFHSNVTDEFIEKLRE